MRRRWMLLLELVLLVGLGVVVALFLIDHGQRPPGGIDLKVQLSGADDKAYLFRDGYGRYHYQILLNDGSVQRLSPEDFARRLHDDQMSRSWMQVLLNVSSPVGFMWVTVGLLGQVLFTGRMVVQWLASEKKRRSVIPPVFWWMSLVGATMLLVYFLWRKDPVGVLGQGFGWFIYVRNLYFIYLGGGAPGSVTEDPGPEPELGK